VTVIGVVHPGAMGAAVAACLAGAGHDVRWASEGRSPETAARAAGLRDVVSIGALVRECELLLSICPPHAAVEVARSVAGFGGLYVDANAISPETARTIAGIIGPGYVDGGIIGPPPRQAGTTRLYLSGLRAGEAASPFEGTPLEARVIDGELTASALKMAYAAWTKGSAALLLAIEATAAELGVGALLQDEWALSQPDAPRRLESARAAAETKAWRWVGEMREIADTFAAAGQPDGFHRAAAEVYEATE
jgi:3-hydroxyisobutyrate dehydrogenase-like beta-hydroxyacid dehydrogenase